jgi:hypothetical protein
MDQFVKQPIDSSTRWTDNENPDVSFAGQLLFFSQRPEVSYQLSAKTRRGVSWELWGKFLYFPFWLTTES